MQSERYKRHLENTVEHESELIRDLRQASDEAGTSLLDKTLVMALGEFGRTPGELIDIAGCDH